MPCIRNFFPSRPDPSASLLGGFHELFAQARKSFRQDRTHRRARDLALSSLVCTSRHTVTGLLCTQGSQFSDWSAAYRLFERRRFDGPSLFRPVLEGVLAMHPEDRPLCVALDTTLLGKTGRKVAGARWRRDPLGPPFQTNLVWSQRFLQTSAILPETFEGPSRARALPIGLRHCPGVKRRPPKGANAMEAKRHRQAVKQTNASVSAVEELALLRRQVDDAPGGRETPIVAAVDGGLTNTTVLRNLPPNTHAIGRLRKDAALYERPPGSPGKTRGRRRVYGRRLPAPEEIRRDDENHPWQTVRVFAGGKEREMRIKGVGPVRWKGLGAADGQLVIVAPAHYRLSKNGRINYRDPAYLLCTDAEMDLTRLLQTYLHRWEIEVDFRDEKTVLGMGEAQTRQCEAVESVPQLMAAAYSMLLLAAEKERRAQGGKPRESAIRPPKWRESNPPARTTTQQLLNELRGEILRRELEEMNKRDFGKEGAKRERGKKEDESRMPFVMAPVYGQK